MSDACTSRVHSHVRAECALTFFFSFLPFASSPASVDATLGAGAAAAAAAAAAAFFSAFASFAAAAGGGALIEDVAEGEAVEVR
jgi:uncharacterized protein (DUF39 family)